MARAATETQKAGLSGLEFGLAIPGTVGGAVWANAGAHDGDIAAVLESATSSWRDGIGGALAAADLGLAYRDSRFKHASRRAAELVLRGDVPARAGRPGRSRSASTTSAAGARRISRWGCRRPAASSATRPTDVGRAR